MAKISIRMKCNGLSLNDQTKKTQASFSNEDPGDSAYSYLNIPASASSFQVGKVYAFEVEAESEAENDNREKMGLP